MHPSRLVRGVRERGGEDGQKEGRKEGRNKGGERIVRHIESIFSCPAPGGSDLFGRLPFACDSPTRPLSETLAVIATDIPTSPLPSSPLLSSPPLRSPLPSSPLLSSPLLS